MYRLFIDIPLGYDQELAQKISEQLAEFVRDHIQQNNIESIKEVNYRLGNDDDRNKSNYLQINENGHVSTKKSKFVFNQDDE